MILVIIFMSLSSSLWIVSAFLLTSNDSGNYRENDCSTGKYLFLISLRDADSMKHFCGGSLIKPNFVLTAAHCVLLYETEPHKVVAVFGCTDTKEVGLQKETASSIYIHGNFNPRDLANDIALVLLESPFQLKSLNNLIKLPADDIQEDLVEVCQKGTAFGWTDKSGGIIGKLKSKLSFKVNLVSRSFEVSVMTRNACALSNGGYLDQSFLCVMGEREHECQEDSGGPYLCGNDVQYGIVEGNKCSTEKKSEYYTRVDIYVGFISYVTKHFPYAPELTLNKRNGVSRYNRSYHETLLILTFFLNIIFKQKNW